LTKAPFCDFIKRQELYVSAYPIRDLKKALVALCHRYYVSAVAFDPHAAQQIAEDLKAEGIDAVSFSQNQSMFNEPIRDLTATILDERFRHNGDSLLRWAVKNAYLKKNPSGLMMFDKQKSVEKIDPIVSLTMAHRICSLAPARASGSLFIS
jgi:phage terminase large subunit-like protein